MSRPIAPQRSALGTVRALKLSAKTFDGHDRLTCKLGASNCRYLKTRPELNEKIHAHAIRVVIIGFQGSDLSRGVFRTAMR